jgi:serine protease Do
MTDQDDLVPEGQQGPMWESEDVEITTEPADSGTQEDSPEQLPPSGRPQKKGMSTLSVAFMLVLVAFVSALLGAVISTLLISFALGINPLSGTLGGSDKPTPIERVIYRGKASSGGISTDPVIKVAEKVQPAVVNIRTKSKGSDSFHQDLDISGEGSGVIFRKDGYIITNNHVIQNAKEIWVTIGADKNVKGTVVGTDSETDLAVVKVDRNNLQVADLGSVKDLRVGELAIAIGSPFGFERTVTAGIVSALNRTVSFSPSTDSGTKTYANLVQTDAAINPGNSGGALCDADGRVIGINTLIYSQTGTYEGIGFAIPIDTARKVANQLIETGKASHPYIGILGTTVDKEYADSHKLQIDQGAVVAEVSEGSPADKVGMKKGDVIIEFDKEKIEDMESLIVSVREKNVGDKVKVVYVRNNKENEVELTLAEKPKVP